MKVLIRLISFLIIISLASCFNDIIDELSEKIVISPKIQFYHTPVRITLLDQQTGKRITNEEGQFEVQILGEDAELMVNIFGQNFWRPKIK